MLRAFSARLLAVSSKGVELPAADPMPTTPPSRESRHMPSPHEPEPLANALTFDSVYLRHVAFIWRSARRLGVPGHALEDVVQDVFVVVYRRLDQFEERTTVKAWLYAILIRVVRQYHRTLRRKRRTGSEGVRTIDPDTLTEPQSADTVDAIERREACAMVDAILDQMDQQRREVFVLAHFEQLTAPEIAIAVGANINTVYWRLRMARREFEAAVSRLREEESR